MWKHEKNKLFFVIRNDGGGTIAFSDEKAEGSTSKKIA
jgi:hypothetical protein